MNSPTRARIFLIDDHILVLESCKRLLEPHHEVVGYAHDARNLMREVQALAPDILLLDISMPEQNGFETATLLKRTLPALKIIFVSMHSEPMFVMEAFRSGGDGYVLKQSVAKELLSAIQHVLDRRYYFSSLIPEEVRNNVTAQITGMPGSELSGRLTSRQTEVLKFIAQGFSSKDISDVLKISERTVVYHKAQIIKALGIKSKAELTKYAINRGILPRTEL